MTLQKTVRSWLLGTWRASPIWRAGVIIPIWLLFTNSSTRDIHPAVLIVVWAVSCVGLANDLAWGVVLDEDQMLMGGLRKRAIARREDVESSYVWKSDSPIVSDEYVALVLRNRDDYRINGSAANCKPEVWVREINRWAQ